MTPDHMVVSLFGDIDSAAALKELKKVGALSRRSVSLSEPGRSSQGTERKNNTHAEGAGCRSGGVSRAGLV